MPKGTINGEPYEVPDGWDVIHQQERARGSLARRILDDLSRSEHGRHEGDAEFQSPTGISQGNPQLQTGQHIGYTISARRIVVPAPRERGNPEAWIEDSNV